MQPLNHLLKLDDINPTEIKADSDVQKKVTLNSNSTIDNIDIKLVSRRRRLRDNTSSSLRTTKRIPLPRPLRPCQHTSSPRQSASRPSSVASSRSSDQTGRLPETTETRRGQLSTTRQERVTSMATRVNCLRHVR